MSLLCFRYNVKLYFLKIFILITMDQVLVFEVLLYYLAIDNLKLNDYEKTDSFICLCSSVFYVR